MSQALIQPASAIASFEYGRRPVWTRLPDGTLTVDYIPLTAEQCLFPLEGDELMTTRWHQDVSMMLKGVLEFKLRDDPSSLVLSGTHVDFGVEGLKHPLPDVIVFRNVRESDVNWATFPVVEQGASIELAVEIVSPQVRGNDVVEKVKIYHQAGIPTYVIIDQPRSDGLRVLRWLEDTPAGYEERSLDSRGWVILESLDLALAIEDNDLVCYDLETQERIKSYGQLYDVMNEAQEVLARESLARADAERKIKLEVGARADAERKAKLEADARADAERKAKVEADARAAAEARIRELERQLQMLQPKSPSE